MSREKEGILQEIKRRKELADYYYDNSRRFHERGDFAKASEFIWGALNELTYAIGLLYGKKLGDHSKVIGFIKELANAYKSREMVNGLIAAQSIHANFYHDFMDELTFEHNKKEIDKLLRKLVEILEKELSRIRTVN